MMEFTRLMKPLRRKRTVVGVHVLETFNPFNYLFSISTYVRPSLFRFFFLIKYKNLHLCGEVSICYNNLTPRFYSDLTCIYTWQAFLDRELLVSSPSIEEDKKLLEKNNKYEKKWSNKEKKNDHKVLDLLPTSEEIEFLRKMSKKAPLGKKKKKSGRPK